MSRILRRPMFRGGSPNNGGIMSYAQPRKGYGEGPDEGGVQGFDLSNYYPSSSDSNFSMAGGLFGDKDFTETTTTSTDAISTDRLQKKAREGDLAQKLGLNPLGQRLREQYLSQRSDPMGKFLINFGLNYMSARPKGGKFGAITTAAEAAKKPTEQLFADQDTDTAMEIKLLSAFGKEKDTDLTRMIKAYARSKNISEEAAEEIISKQKFESPTGFLKDYSDTALIRKFGEDWGKSSRVDNATQRNNYGKFRLKYEKGQIDEKITGLFPDKGNEVMDLDTVTKRKDNSNIYDITDKQSEKDYEVGKVYVNVSPSGRGFYIVKQDGSKRILFKIGEY
jgi:hypothetical protein